MEQKFLVSGNQANTADIIILGVGSCGEDLSLQLIDAGLDVIGIEAHLVGGECPYYACLPSKGMVRASSIVGEVHKAGNLAGKVDFKPDWSLVAKRVREITGDWDDSIAVRRYHDRGGRLVKGYGKITGPNTVKVGDLVFTARRGIVIATGTKPAIPELPGLQNVNYWTTRDVMKLEKLPGSMTIIGGGPVSCELGQVFSRYGVNIIIVQSREQLLKREEPEAAETLKSIFASEGIEVITGARVQQVNASGGNIAVKLNNGRVVISEALMVAVGRVTDLSGLGLESLKIDSKSKFIDVDERMRVTNGVWAMGDVTGKALLTSVADYQSAIIAADILGREHPPASYHAVPRVIFTDPEVGAVGITESEARAADLDITVIIKEIAFSIRGFLHGSEKGLLKLVVDRQAGILVGATVVGPHAGEVLGMLSLAVHARIPISELQSMIYGFPTFCGSIGEAIGAYARGVTTVFDPSYDMPEL